MGFVAIDSVGADGMNVQSYLYRVALCCCVVATLGGARIAAAQQTPAATTAPSETLGEVIVTAQRRSERLQDVPIAIVAEDAAQLQQAGVSNIRDLTVITPGLRLSGTGADAQPAIRGVHSDQTDPGNDPNVAIYVDGVYQSNQLADNFDLGDIDRVEVLKGPQGTLFGRNATGGAIRIFTLGPSFTPTGSFDLGYGNLNQAIGKVYVAGPLIGNVVAGSVSGYYQASDGYTRDVPAGKDDGGISSEALRAKLLIQPNDALTINLLGTYVWRFDGNATQYQPADGNTIARLFPGAIISTAPRTYANTYPAIVTSTLYTGAAKVDYTTPVGTLSSTLAYNDVTAYYYTDADLTQLNLLNYPIYEKQNDHSVELTFTSIKLGITQFTAGTFWYHSLGRYDPLVVSGSFSTPTIYGFQKQSTNAIAGFTELNIQPVDPLEVILGVRYSSEEKSANGAYFLQPTRPPSEPPLGVPTTWDSVTPRTTVRYTLPTGDNLYATYSQGFKSGGFNISGLQPTPFKPETLKAFEVGLKTVPSRMVSGDFSVFYYDYKDQQVQSIVNGFNITANAASSHIYGADADINWRPVEEFNLRAALSYLHARYAVYPDAVFNVPTEIPGIPPPCRCGNTTTTGDLSGAVEPFSPTWTAGLVGDYRKELDRGTFDFSTSWYRTAKFSFVNNSAVEQPAYDTLAVRTSFQPKGSNFTVYLWGKNLTNKLYLNTYFASNAGDGVTYSPPRTYGLGVNYKY